MYIFSYFDKYVEGSGITVQIGAATGSERTRLYMYGASARGTKKLGAKGMLYQNQEPVMLGTSGTRN